MKAVDQYLNDILAPTLRKHGASENYVIETLNVVAHQMYSLLKCWNNSSVRKTILLLGAEEGLFYDPPSKKDVRCFVVVTLRNSPLERIQSDSFVTTGARQAITNADVKNITSAAIRYFNALDFETLSLEAQTHTFKNIYLELLESHPVTAMALQRLATGSAKQVDYSPVIVHKPFELPELDQIKEDAERSDNARSSTVTYDGFSAEIEPELRRLLTTVTRSSAKVFLTASFKSLTRNPQCLFDVMEFLLTHGCIFVTPNYLVENGHLEKRVNLLRACHTDLDATKNYQQLSQLCPKHRMVIKSAIGK